MRSGSGIAETNCHIAQPTLVADTTDGAAFSIAIEILVTPVQQPHQTGTVETVAHIKIGQGRTLGKFVPGAKYLAIIAAIDTIADQAAQFQWNAALEFDCQVRNATPGVELVGRNDGRRRTDIDASTALTAMRTGGCIHRQGQIGEPLTEKKHRAGVTIE